MNPLSLGPSWSRAVALAVCASALAFVGGTALQLMSMVAPVLGLFFGGWLISCTLEPGVSWVVQHTRLRRTSAVGLTYLGILAPLAVAWLALSPALGDSFSAGVRGLPLTVDAFQRRAIQFQGIVNGWLVEHGLAIKVDLGSQLNLDSVTRQLQGQILAEPWGALSLAGNATSAIAGIGLMLLLSVYFLTGGRQLADLFVRLFPGRMEADVCSILSAIHDAFGGFLRSQVVQAVVFTCITWACLVIAQVDDAPVVAGMAGLLLLIPMVGAPLALVPPVVATLVWRPEATPLVLITLGVLQALVLNVLGPRLMSRQLGLPPILVLFGILAGAQLGGLFGALLGVPTLAALMTIVTRFRTPR